VSDDKHLRWNAEHAGKRAEGPDAGYWVGHLTINNRKRILRAHRVAWALSTGRWPPDLIDHINRVKRDNRLANLREATHAQNLQNKSPNLYRVERKAAIRVVVTIAEKEKMRRVAAHAGMSLSVWLRSIVLEKARRRVKKPARLRASLSAFAPPPSI
jgi:hypothetical protein